MKLSRKKLSQKGFLSLHIVLPAVVAIAAIGGIGAYVLMKNSHAMTPVAGGKHYYFTCSVSASPAKPVVGSSFKVTYTIKNTGNATYTGWNGLQGSIVEIASNGLPYNSNSTSLYPGNLNFTLAPGAAKTLTGQISKVDGSLTVNGKKYAVKSVKVNIFSMDSISSSYKTSGCVSSKSWAL